MSVPGGALILQLFDEAADSIEHHLRLIAVRRMTAVGELNEIKTLYVRRISFQRRYLRRRAVLVVLAENGQDWATNAGKIAFDRPGFEFRVEPYVSPAPEHAVHVVVIAG